jgi:MFS transporter, putative metabolite:H+ symporter
MAALANPVYMKRYPVSTHLDRLPIGSFHQQIMWMLAYVYFFELGDINSFAFAAPALRERWHLSVSTIGFLTSGAFVGMFVGATLGGWFSDKVGRKKALLFTTVWYSASSLLNAFAWDVPGLFITRCLTGIGLSAMTVAAITYISEMFPARKRGTYQALIMVIGLLGIPVTSFVAHLFIPMFAYGWRLVFVWGALGLFVIFFANKLEESPHWYENQGRLADADAAVDRIETRIKGQFGSLPPIPATTPTTSPTTPRKGSFADLMAPAYRSRTTVLVATWIFQTLGLFGFMAWVPTLLAAHGFSVVKSLAWTSMMYVGAPLGASVAALISDRWERKYSITVFALLIGAFGLMFGGSTTMVPIVAFGFLVSLCIQAFAPLLYAYTPECYPTQIRSLGSGVSYGLGRLANVLGPLVVALLFTHYGYVSVFVYLGLLWALVALIIGAFGPKTKGQSLV